MSDRDHDMAECDLEKALTLKLLRDLNIGERISEKSASENLWDRRRAP